MKKNLITLVLLMAFVSIVNAQIPNNVPTNGLVGWWPFSGNANDSSGNNSHGTVYGATLSTDRFGKPNSSYYFNVANWRWASAGDYIYIPYNQKYNFTEFTISVWVKRTSDGSTLSPQSLGIIRRFQYGYSNPNGEAWTLDIAHGSSSGGSNLYGVVVQQASSPAPYHVASTVSTVPLNKWTHIVMRYTAKTIDLYIDGKKLGSSQNNNITINTTGNSGISVGISDQANGHWCPFDGYIDDIAIWNRALDSTEIKNAFLGCDKTITQQPSNITTSYRSADFTCLGNDTLQTYQWQILENGNWINLKDSAQFSGTATSQLSLKQLLSKNNGQKFRCIVKGSCLNETSQEATLNFNCNGTIVQQPLNQGMFSGQAKFTCKTNDTLVSYQWETNTGTGWSKLFNAGQYSGVTTDTLKVSNVTSTNNNQLFRCIIKGDCLTDTTEEVSLKVWGLGVNSFDLVDFKVYPNPSSTQVIIDNGNYRTMGSYNAKIVNALGQTVFQSAINQQQFVIDAKTMGGAGVYTLYITDANNKVVGVKKIVLQ